MDAWNARLIVGYKILTSMSRSPEDWNLEIFLEHKSYAEMDVPDAVWDEVEANALAAVRRPETEHLIADKDSWRRVVGSRMFREVAWVSG